MTTAAAASILAVALPEPVCADSFGVQTFSANATISVPAGASSVIYEIVGGEGGGGGGGGGGGATCGSSGERRGA